MIRARSIYFPTWQRWGFPHTRNRWVEARAPEYIRRPNVPPLQLHWYFDGAAETYWYA